MAHDDRMQEYFATANREKMRRPYPRRDRGPAAKPLAQLRRREEDAASGAKLEMARCKNKLNRAGFHPLSCRAKSSCQRLNPWTESENMRLRLGPRHVKVSSAEKLEIPRLRSE